MGKDLILKLKVKTGTAVVDIKNVATALKDLEKTSLNKDISDASDEMKNLGKNASKTAEEYRKIVDASKADAERLKENVAIKKSASDAEMKAIADASKADADRLKKSIIEDKQIVAERNKAHAEAIRMEKRRVVEVNNARKESALQEKQRLASINNARKESARVEKQRASEEIRQIAEASKADSERYRARVKAEKQKIASINRDHAEAIRMHKQITAEVEKSNKKMGKQVGIVNRIKKSLFTLRSYWLAISAAISIAAISVAKFFTAGFTSVEKFRLSVASVAASITTFSDLSAGDVAEVYNKAYKYSEKLALKMEIINVKTIATGEQLRAMNETFIQQGVLLDVNSQKQEDAFVSVANAISLITQGQNQEIQMRQEIRGLLSGDIRATNLLARMIDTKLGGTLKENIALWKQQGTLLENLGSHLEGFKAGSADLASTWAALSTTFETISNRWLRGVFKPIYEDIIKVSLKFSRSLLDQKASLGYAGNILKGEILTAWENIKSIAKGFWNILDGLKEPLMFMLKTINLAVKGWALIFEHVTNIALTMKEKFLTEEGVRSWIIPFLRSIGYEGDVITPTPLGEEEGEAEIVEKPTLVATKTDKQLAAEEAYWKKINELDREYHREKIKLEYEGFEKRKKLLQLETDYLVAEYKDSLDIVEMIKKVHDVKMAQIGGEERKVRLKDEEDLREAARKMAEEQKEAHDAVIKYISSERENKVRAIFEEADALKYAAKNKEELNKIAEVATEKIQALETETIAERKKNHDLILQYTSTELENKIRAIDTEKEKLLELATTYGEVAAIYEESALRKQELRKQDLTSMEEWAATSISLMEQVEAVNIRGAESFSSGFADAFIDFAEGSKTAKEAIVDFAVTFFNQLTRMIIQQFLLNSIKKMMGTTSATASAQAVAGNAAEAASVASLTTAYLALAAAKAVAGASSGGGGGGATVAAKGMVVSNGQKMMEYAQGGVVDRPTTFPMRDGTGLMGEAGPEAIMPLKRGKDGKLGVEVTNEKAAQPIPQEVNIVNVINPSMLDEYLASSKGQDAILNVIGNKGQTIKRILR